METGPPVVVVVVWIVVDVEVGIVDSAEVGIVGDAIAGLGLVAQLCRHCLNTWTSLKACSSRCVRPRAKSGHGVVCCASTVAQSA